MYSWRDSTTSEYIRDNNVFHSFPNPFNNETSIVYYLPENGQMSLIIYNILGQEIVTLVDDEKFSGVYTAHWDGNNKNGIAVSAGVYFCLIRSGNYLKSIKLLLLK